MKRFAGFSVYLHAMMRVPSVVTTSLALMLSMAVAPPAALAEPFRGGPSGPVAATPPSPPPTPSVVEYPTGRYELRGDGVGTPYIWVWIPNPPSSPPSSPPAEPPPLAPAPAAPPTGPGASDGSSPPHHSQLYRWVDPEGVVHWTDRVDAVAEAYRSVVVDRAPSLR